MVDATSHNVISMPPVSVASVQSMTEWLRSVLFLVAGVLLILFRRRFADHVVNSQKWVLGLRLVEGERQRIALLAAAVGCLLIGLSVFGVAGWLP